MHIDAILFTFIANNNTLHIMDLQETITAQRIAICKKLRYLRLSKNLSSEQVFTALGMNRASLSRYENGKINISLDMLIKFAEYYGCNLSIIFESK